MQIESFRDWDPTQRRLAELLVATHNARRVPTTLLTQKKVGLGKHDRHVSPPRASKIEPNFFTTPLAPSRDSNDLPRDTSRPSLCTTTPSRNTARSSAPSLFVDVTDAHGVLRTIEVQRGNDPNALADQYERRVGGLTPKQRSKLVSVIQKTMDEHLR
jgi:hypothetical protein